jgi:hypothetical protein
VTELVAKSAPSIHIMRPISCDRNNLVLTTFSFIDIVIVPYPPGWGTIKGVFSTDYPERDEMFARLMISEKDDRSF